MLSRQYMIFNTTEIDTIDFSQVCETSPETLRKNSDSTKTFVKWDCEDIPACVEELTTKEGPYSHSEILEILSGQDWSAPIEIGNTSNSSSEPIVIGNATETTTEPIAIGMTSSPSASGEPL